MRGKLTLVVSNTEIKDKIMASIRPEDRDVQPSSRFRQKMKLRLLKLQPRQSQAVRAA